MRHEPIATQAVIEAPRFDLRPLRRSDIGLIGMHCADARVARMTATLPHPMPPGLPEAMVARSAAPGRTEDIWAIDGGKAGQPEVMGLISLERMDAGQGRVAQCEVSYWVIPAYWNTGLASEALRALVEANPQECRTMFASVFQDNPASARVLTNGGFDYIGDAETFCVARDATVPTWTYIRNLG